MKEYLLQGNEACAEGAIYAGCRFYAGYPITPSTEIMERIVKRFPECGGVFIQMEDEIASIGAVIGASWAGAKAMTATSGPGLSLMMENIGYAAMTESPSVIIDVQRAGPATGQATRPAQGDMMQARWGSHGDSQIIALSPWSVQEMWSETIRAFNLAEEFRVPVLVMADEAIGHLRERCLLTSDIKIISRKKGIKRPPFGGERGDLVPPMPIFGEAERLLITGSTHDEWGYRRTSSPDVQERLIKRLNDKISKGADKIIEKDEYLLEDAEIVVIAYGFTARSSIHAVKLMRGDNYKVGMLRLKTIWPFPEKRVKEIGNNAKVILFPEMNMGQMVREVERFASCDVVSMPKVNGEVITPIEIIDKIKKIT